MGRGEEAIDEWAWTTCTHVLSLILTHAEGAKVSPWWLAGCMLHTMQSVADTSKSANQRLARSLAAPVPSKAKFSTCAIEAP